MLFFLATSSQYFSRMIPLLTMDDFEIADSLAGTWCMRSCCRSPSRAPPGAVVPTAIEDDDLAASGKMFDVSL